MGTKATLLQRVLIVLASLGLFACGGGDFGSDFVEEGDVVVVPVIGSVESNSFQPESVGIEPSEIASGGTALLTVAAVWSDTGELVIEPLAIEFTSQCASEEPPRAVITPQLQIQAGVYQAEYEATGCIGDDVVVVNLDGAVAATGVISILSAEVGTIQFVSAEPEQIALSGFGSATFPEFSDVTFRVLDASGLPVEGRTVSFELTNDLGGVSLVNTSAVSNQAGDVVARVQSGIINTTVRVIASYTTAGGQLVQTISGPIAINSGLADQDSFDIATTVFNPLAWNYNYPLSPPEEAPVTISVFAADYFNNPVPDGTQITLVSESGGQIGGNCATVQGSCAVPWASSGERPANGVLTIVARVVGEESFDDANGNGLFDVAEFNPANDLDEAFLDANENGVYDAGETFFDFNSDGLYTRANGLYDGAGCTEEAANAGHCAMLVEDRQDIRLVLSGDDLTILFETGGVVLDTVGTEICYTIADGRNNIPPAGTAITVTVSVGEIIAGPTNYDIPNAFQTQPYRNCVFVRGEADQADGGEAEGGRLTVRAEVPDPSGLVWEASVGLTEFKAPAEAAP